MMVLVTEDVGTGPDAEKRDSIVIAEPLEQLGPRDVPHGLPPGSRGLPELRSSGAEAFNVTNAAYRVAFAWDATPNGRPCLAISVARSGDPLGPDFKAHGCVPTDEPAATVASLDRAGGGAIEVAAWFFDTSSPAPEADQPRSTLEAATSRHRSGGRM